jgi:hypothetical protein
MAKGYRRVKEKLQIEGHTIQWPLVAFVLSDLRFVASVDLVSILWLFYTMTTIYRRDKQKLQIEGQTIQWPQDTDEINRSYKSKVRKYNGQRIPTS